MEDFPSMRSSLNDHIDRLVVGVAELNTQVQDSPCLDTAVRVIKANIRDETETFSNAAVFISLRLHHLWTEAVKEKALATAEGRTPSQHTRPDSPASWEEVAAPEVDEDEDGVDVRPEPSTTATTTATTATATTTATTTATAGLAPPPPPGTAPTPPTPLDPVSACCESISILRRAAQVLHDRLKWAMALGKHNTVDKSVLEAYSFEANRQRSPMDILRDGFQELGRKVIRNKRNTLLTCLGVGIATAIYMYNRSFSPIKRAHSSLSEVQALNASLPSFEPARAQLDVAKANLRSKAGQVIRNTVFCATLSVSVSVAAASYLAAEVAATEASTPVALTSEFVQRVVEVRDRCQVISKVTPQELLGSLSRCWESLLAYMAFTDLRECCICREIVTPMDSLVSSEGAVSDCASKHVFHEGCLPLEWALAYGCPVCRRPVTGLQEIRIDPLFRLHPDVLKEAGTEDGTTGGGGGGSSTPVSRAGAGAGASPGPSGGAGSAPVGDDAEELVG